MVATFKIDAGLEKIEQFSNSHFPQNKHFIQSHSFLLHNSIPYIVYGRHSHHFYQNCSSLEVRIVNHFL
jgi:hypothetical protein